MKPILLIAALAGLATAQPKLPELAVLSITDVIPSKLVEYQAGLATVRDAYKKAGSPVFLGYNRVFGGANVLSVRTLNDLSSFNDGPSGFLIKSMGEAAYRKFFAQYSQTFTGTRNLLIRPVAGLNIQDAPTGSLPLLVLTRSIVASGRAAEFEARLRDVVMPAMKKAGVKRYVVTRVVFGGGMTEYVIFRGHNSLVDAEKANDLVAKLAPAPAGLVTSAERTVYRIDPKTSYSEGVEIR
jgi:hypothetical protein